MLHKCANPACPSLFRSLSLGKLFVLETDFGEGFTPPRSRRHRSLRPWSAIGYAMVALPYSP
jgi:hypothetical protein